MVAYTHLLYFKNIQIYTGENYKHNMHTNCLACASCWGVGKKSFRWMKEKILTYKCSGSCGFDDVFNTIVAIDIGWKLNGKFGMNGSQNSSSAIF